MMGKLNWVPLELLYVRPGQRKARPSGRGAGAAAKRGPVMLAHPHPDAALSCRRCWPLPRARAAAGAVGRHGGLTDGEEDGGGPGRTPALSENETAPFFLFWIRPLTVLWTF